MDKRFEKKPVDPALLQQQIVETIADRNCSCACSCACWLICVPAAVFGVWWDPQSSLLLFAAACIIIPTVFMTASVLASNLRIMWAREALARHEKGM